MRRLELVRCDRCERVLYAKPNGITAGDRCDARIPAEWYSDWTGTNLLMTTCFGTFHSIGKLIPSKPSAILV